MRLSVLPESCLEHALLFLGDVSDLLYFASTCSAAALFVRTHWSRLKPDGAYFRRKFMAEMSNQLGGAARSPAFRDWTAKTPPRLSPPPLVDDVRKKARWEMALPKRSYLDLDKEFQRGGGQRAFVTSLRVSGEWMNHPDSDSDDGARLDLDSRGQVLLRMYPESVRMELESDGSLELMRFMKRLQLNLAFPHYKLFNSSPADVTVVIGIVYIPVEEEEEGSDERTANWETDVLSECVRADAATAPIRVRVPDELRAVEYITVHHHAHDARLPPVRRFVLIVRYFGGGGVWRGEIQGWACRRIAADGARGYRLPIPRLCFLLLDKVDLEIEFESPPRSGGGAEVFVCVGGHNIASQSGGMLRVLS